MILIEEEAQSPVPYLHFPEFQVGIGDRNQLRCILLTVRIFDPDLAIHRTCQVQLIDILNIQFDLAVHSHG